MGNILDPVGDRNLTLLHRINNIFDLPEFVKSAESNTISEDDVKHLPPGAFGDPAKRKFPCHTKAATFLSYSYFLHGKNEMTKTSAELVDSRLNNYIDHWGIRLECDRFKEQFTKEASEVAQELPDDCYAIVEQYDDQAIRRLPIVNAETVKAAAESLWTNRDKYPYTWRRAAARKILSKAAQFNTAIPEPHGEYINKCAGFCMGLPAKIAQAMFGRAMLMNADAKLKHGDLQIAFVKAAKLVMEQPPTPQLLEKTAELIAGIDTELSFHRLYSRGLPTPEEVVYEVTEKTASSIQNAAVQMTNGTAYRRCDIEKAGFAPFKLIDENMEEDLADPLGEFDLEKAATILKTLPRPDADLYEKGMNLLNINSEAQIRKQAGIPANMATWTKDDWLNYTSAMGAKEKTTDFKMSITLPHPQRLDTESIQ